MFARLRPFLLLALLGLIFFAPLVRRPTETLYSKRSDMIGEYVPEKRFLVRSWRETGELPLWCPYLFAGEPFAHDIQVGVFYPPHWLLFLFPPEAAGAVLSWLVVGHVIAAGWCMYGYARARGLGGAGALAAAMSYMFAGKWMFHLLDAGHTVLIGLAWLPLALLFLESAVRRGSLVRATAAGAAAALMVLGTHPQWSFYAALLAAGLSLGTALESAGFLGGSGPRSARRTGAALGRWLGLGMWAALTAFALSAVQLWPTLEAASQATRGGGVAPDDVVQEFLLTTHELIGPGPVVCQRWENRAGLGVLALAAAVLAPLLCRGPVRWQAGVWLALWALGLGLGTLLGDVHFPGFHTFRLHVRVLVLAGLLTALLVGATTDALFARAVALPRRQKIFAIVLVIATLAAGLAALASESVLGIPAGEQVRFPYYPLALALIVPAGAALLILRLRGAPGPAGRATCVWLGLLLFELWTIAWPLVEVRDEAGLYRPSACVSYLIGPGGGPGPAAGGRVLDCCVRDSLGHSALGAGSPLGPIYGLEALGGYNSLDVHRYREYLQLMADNPAPVRPFEGLFGDPILLGVPVHNKPLADLLGVRYLLQPRDPADQPEGHVPAREPAWERVLEDDHARSFSFPLGGVRPLPPYEVWKNPAEMPRAFVVPHAEPLPDRPLVLDKLKTTDFKQTVLLEGWRDEFASAAPGAAYRAAEVASYRPNRVALHTEGPAAWLVLADIYFPGWNCTVNGRPAEIHRADFLFRAVAVPEGPCDVVFTFEPETYLRGRELSLGGAALVAVLFLGAGLRRFLAARRKPAGDRSGAA